jgi:hypothetical protein
MIALMINVVVRVINVQLSALADNQELEEIRNRIECVLVVCSFIRTNDDIIAWQSELGSETGGASNLTLG